MNDAGSRAAAMNDDRTTARELEAARAGDAEALGRVLESCRKYLLAVAARGIGADLAAKVGASDLVQEALLGAHRDFTRFTGRSRDELLAWLRAILQNGVAVSARRYRATSKRHVGREIQAGVPGASALWEKLVSDAPTPGTEAVRREQIDLLRAALARLREDDRRVLVWHQYDGLTFGEIGRRLGRSDEAARKLWSRALVRLSHELRSDRACPPKTM